MDLNTDECFDILRFETTTGNGNSSLKGKGNVHFYDETDSGICGSEYNTMKTDITPHMTEEERKCQQTPVIVINEDEIVDNIEMAKIESYYERILTPEGNVKYKNYRIIAPAPTQLRMYSPSGDIHTTPKKGKIVPKFDLFHDSVCPRDKLLTLINRDHLACKELEAIIKPSELNKRILEMIRLTNKSSMEDRIEFLNSVLSPSPSSLSILSDDSVFLDVRYKTPSPILEKTTKSNHLIKSYSIEVDDMFIKEPKKRKNVRRQISYQCNDENAYHMNLCDELKYAEEMCPRSYTPRKMTDFEYHFFHRPASSFSNHFVKCHDPDKPRESKKSIIRNFIQKNMIDRSINRDKLAKLALAIEEDTEPENIEFVSSARQLEDKLTFMLDEVKTWKNELVEIQDDIQDDDRKVAILLADARTILTEIRSTNYLDDIIHLLHGNIETVAKHKTWPFMGYVNGERKCPHANLII